MEEEVSSGFSYPGIPEKNWWGLRERLKNTPSARVTVQWLAPELHMTERSARANVLPSLVTLGIIDNDGALTDRGRRWRLDDSYPSACDEMLRLYPEELRSAYQGSDLDKAQVANWIMGHANVGPKAAAKYAAVYVMLSKKQIPPKTVPRQPRVGSGGRSNADSKKVSPSAAPTGTGSMPGASRRDNLPRPVPDNPEPEVEERLRPRLNPAIHIDIQIHIPPDASAELIDRIFESMARELKNLY